MVSDATRLSSGAESNHPVFSPTKDKPKLPPRSDYAGVLPPQ